MDRNRLLAAGLVRRYHTVPDEGRGQTVAEHSWGVAMLIATYHPNPSVNLLKAALNHDLSESITGDLPATVKWKHPGLTEIVRDIEHDIRVEHGWEVELTLEEQYWLRACDMLELYLYSERRSNGRDEWSNVVGRAWVYINNLKREGSWPKELVI